MRAYGAPKSGPLEVAGAKQTLGDKVQAALPVQVEPPTRETLWSNHWPTRCLSEAQSRPVGFISSTTPTHHWESVETHHWESVEKGTRTSGSRLAGAWADVLTSKP